VTQDNTPEDFEHLSGFLVHTCTNVQPWNVQFASFMVGSSSSMYTWDFEIRI